MASFFAKSFLVALLGLAPMSVLGGRHSSCGGLGVINDGEPAGEVKRVDGSEYQSHQLDQNLGR